MKHILEFWHRSDMIASVTSEAPIWPEPQVGETVMLQLRNNSAIEDHGVNWVVRSRRLVFFDESLGIHTLQIYCEPQRP